MLPASIKDKNSFSWEAHWPEVPCVSFINGKDNKWGFKRGAASCSRPNYELGVIACLVVRLIGLLLAFASQKKSVMSEMK